MPAPPPRDPSDGRPHLHVLEAPPPDDHDERQPPQDIAAERAVLGAILTSRRALDATTPILTGRDFHSPAHEIIWDAATHLYARLEGVDPITVAHRLQATGLLNRAGGTSYLHTLVADVITTTNADYHARIIAERAALRRIAATGAHLQQLGQLPTGDVPAILAAAQAELTALTELGVPGAEPPPHPWAPIDLTDVLNGTHTTPTATVLTRRDGKALLYPAAVHSIAGEPGSGKSWAALIAVTQELEQGHPVLYIDHEDRPASIVNRLRSLGVTTDQLTTGLRYVRPENAIDATGWTHIATAAAGARLAVIDGITEAMALHGMETNSNDDAARWLALIPNRLANLGCAVLQIDHVTKNSDTRGRYALGAQHKLAGITGTAYKLVVIKAMAKGAKGHAKLIVDKDKHGDVGPVGVTAADLHLDATDDTGVIRAWLDTPGIDHDDEGRFRPTVLMGRVSEFLQAHPGATGAAIRGGVRGKATAVLEALGCLVREGYVRTEDAPRGGFYHYVVEPFGSTP